MILVCHAISQDHMMKGLCDFIGKSPSTEIIILPNLLVIGTFLVDIKWFWLVT